MAREYAGWGFLGFGSFSGERDPQTPAVPGMTRTMLLSNDRFVVVPYWAIAVTAGVGGLLRLRSRLRSSLDFRRREFSAAAAPPANSPG